MSDLIVFLEDKIRDERVRLNVNVESSVDEVIAWYVEYFRLPRRDFDLSHIEYQLFRPVDETRLPGQTTFRQAGIAKGELLELVSRDGRRVWKAVHFILDEIESEIKDRTTGKLKEKIIEEAWERIKKKLDEIEKTRTGGNRVDEICEWIDQMGGPKEFIKIGEKIADVVEKPYSATKTVRSKELSTKATVGSLFKTIWTVIVTAGAIVLISFAARSLFPDPPDPTELPPPVTNPTEPPEEEPPPPPENVAPEEAEPELSPTPHPGDDFFNEGIAFLKEEAYEEAISQFNQAEAMGLETVDLYLARARACRQLEYDSYACEAEQVLSDYTRVIEVNPDNFWIYISRGTYYYQILGDDESGLRDLDMAVAIAPDDPNPYFHRGCYYLFHEDWEEVIADFTRAIPFEPEWADLYGHRGTGYQELGMIAEARTDYEKFLELTEGNPEYYDWRVDLQRWLDENPQ